MPLADERDGRAEWPCPAWRLVVKGLEGLGQIGTEFARGLSTHSGPLFQFIVSPGCQSAALCISLSSRSLRSRARRIHAISDSSVSPVSQHSSSMPVFEGMTKDRTPAKLCRYILSTSDEVRRA